MKKLLAFFLALVMLLPLAVACKDDEPGGEVQTLDVIKNGACVIYYDATTTSNATLKKLQDAIEEVTGTRPEAKRSGTPTPGAILLGNMELPDGSRVGTELRSKDFMLGIVSGYYVISAIEFTQTEKAVDHFVKNLLPKMAAETKTLTLTSNDDTRNDGEYRVGTTTVGGKSLGHFSIQVSNNPTISEWRTAVLLREHIRDDTGYPIEIIKNNTAATENVILIGEDLCSTEVTADHDYAVSINGTVIEVVAESVFGYMEAQETLFEDIFATRERNAPVTLTNESGKSGNGKDQACEPLETNGDVRIMFNNIHGQTENGDMPVEQPTKMLVELYAEYLPDVLGLQECTNHSFNAGIETMLIGLGYAKAYGANVATSLFYRTETLELLQSDDFCFDKLEREFAEDDHIYKDLIENNGYTTDQIYNDNKNKDGLTGQSRKDSSKRVTWGIFRHKATGNVFLAGSTHLWWEGNETLDDIVRMVQMRALRNILSEAAAKFAADNNLGVDTIPIFVGGDYNSEYGGNRTSLTTMTDPTNSYVYVNVNDFSTAKLKDTTHHSYATYDKDLEIYVDLNTNNNAYDRALDHIFVNTEAQGMITPNYTGILDDDYAYLSSDHLAIYTDVTFKTTAPKITR